MDRIIGLANPTCTQTSKAKIKVIPPPSHLRLRTRLFFWGRSRKSMRKSIRACVSFDVNPWMRPKKLSVSLMVNSLYSARSCQVGKTQTVNAFRASGLPRPTFAASQLPADKESLLFIYSKYLQWNSVKHSWGCWKTLNTSNTEQFPEKVTYELHFRAGLVSVTAQVCSQGPVEAVGSASTF